MLYLTFFSQNSWNWHSNSQVKAGLLHWGHLGVWGEIFGCLTAGATSILWAEAREAAKYPMVNRSARYGKEFSSTNVNIAEVESAVLEVQESFS